MHNREEKPNIASATQLLLPFRFDLFGFALSRAIVPVLMTFAATVSWEVRETTVLQIALYLLATLAAITVAFVSRRRGDMPSDNRDSTRSENMAPVCMAACGLTGAVLISVGVVSEVFASSVAGYALVGACGGYYETIWGRRFIGIGTEKIQPYTLLMIAVSTTACIVISLFSPLVLCGAVGLLCIGTALFYRIEPLRREPPGPLREPNDSTGAGQTESGLPAAEARSYARQLFNLTLCCLAFSAIYNFVVTLAYDFIPAATATQIRFVANLAVILSLFLLCVTLRPVRAVTLFRFVLPVTAFGFVLFLMAPGVPVDLSLAISSIGRKLFDVLTWVLVARAIDSFSLKPDLNFGPLVAGKNFGYLLGVVAAQIALDSAPGAAQIAAAVPSLLLVLISLFFWVFPERSIDQVFSSENASGTVGSGSTGCPASGVEGDGYDARVSRLAQTHGCTSRETEVLVLLARGRTQTVIADKLGISPGTVHTHTLHIYQKFGVNSRQDLIELLEENSSVPTTGNVDNRIAAERE